MFTKKVRRSWINATDSFLAEMLRAILKEMARTDVYLTQATFKTQKDRKPEQFETRDEWKNVDRVLEVEGAAFCATIDSQRPYVPKDRCFLPLLPSATAKFILIHEVNDKGNWKLSSAEVSVEHFPFSWTTEKVSLAFLGDGHWLDKASDHLCLLAEELRHRGPSQLRDDE
jgi:hypothetical protein